MQKGEKLIPSRFIVGFERHDCGDELWANLVGVSFVIGGLNIGCGRREWELNRSQHMGISGVRFENSDIRMGACGSQIVDSTAGSYGHDTIKDFVSGVDRIRIKADGLLDVGDVDIRDSALGARMVIDKQTIIFSDPNPSEISLADFIFL